MPERERTGLPMRRGCVFGTTEEDGETWATVALDERWTEDEMDVPNLRVTIRADDGAGDGYESAWCDALLEIWELKHERDDLRARVEELERGIDSHRELHAQTVRVLEKAKSALYDSQYGRGLSQPYLHGVDKEITEHIADLRRPDPAPTEDKRDA